MNAKNIFRYVVLGISLPLTLIVVLAFTLPLAISLWTSITASAESVSVPYLFRTILYTFAQSLCSLLLAIAVGLPAAFLIARRNSSLGRILASFSSIPLCVPALIVALGYISTFGIAGSVNRALMKAFNLEEAPLRFLYSFWGIIICQGFYNFPIIMATVADTWASLSSEQADSARLLGASERKVFFSVTLHQILPALGSACIPVFLYCFFSFMIVQLFGAVGTTTLEVAIYHAGRSTLRLRTATILALIETLCVGAVLLTYTFAERNSLRNKGLIYAPKSLKPKEISLREKLLFLPYTLIIAIFFLLPFFSIIISSFTVRSGGSLSFSFSPWKRLITQSGFFKALLNTFTCATGTALLCTITGFVYAAFLRLRRNEHNAFLTTIPFLPMIVSSVVMGIGMTLLVKRGTPLILVFAQTALSWPFAFRQIYTSLQKIPNVALDSARLLSRHKTDIIFSILLPYAKKSLLSTFGFCFAISTGDATLPFVLAIPRYDTLSLLTFRLANGYHLSEACACGIFLGLICTIIFSVANSAKGNE